MAWCSLLFDFSDREPIAVSKETFCIGRLPESDLCEADARISSKHCKIVLDGDIASLADNSSFGTFLNGKKIGKGNSHTIKDGDVIALIENEPNFTFTFRRQDAGAEAQARPAAAAEKNRKQKPALYPQIAPDPSEIASAPANEAPADRGRVGAQGTGDVVVNVSNEGSLVPYPNPQPPLRADRKKGETKAQMDNAAEIQKRQVDMSIDSEWTVNRFGLVDVYQVLVLLAFPVPKLLIMFPLLFFLMLPATVLNYMYIVCLPAPTMSINRSSCLWTMHCVIQWAISLPAQLLVVLNYCLDSLVMVLFGALWCTLTLAWGRYFRNLKVIRPHTGGPSLYSHFADFVCVTSGMMYRTGFWSFMFSFTVMFLVNPWVKYWVSCNPFVHELGERFLTQIGQPLSDMSIEDIDANLKKCLSRAKHEPANRDEVDDLHFVPHYPYPPKGRQYALGLQHVSRTTMLTHTTHMRGEHGNAFVLSKCAYSPAYRVMLWYNNPFHPFTGYVEASISNGQPTQPEKFMGGEHPMWMVNGHSYLASAREAFGSLGGVDGYFDSKVVPHVSRFIRGNVRGWKIADEFFAKDPKMGYEGKKLLEAAAKRRK